MASKSIFNIKTNVEIGQMVLPTPGKADIRTHTRTGIVFSPKKFDDQFGHLSRGVTGLYKEYVADVAEHGGKRLRLQAPRNTGRLKRSIFWTGALTSDATGQISPVKNDLPIFTAGREAGNYYGIAGVNLGRRTKTAGLGSILEPRAMLFAKNKPTESAPYAIEVERGSGKFNTDSGAAKGPIFANLAGPKGINAVMKIDKEWRGFRGGILSQRKLADGRVIQVRNRSHLFPMFLRSVEGQHPNPFHRRAAADTKQYALGIRLGKLRKDAVNRMRVNVGSARTQQAAQKFI